MKDYEFIILGAGPSGLSFARSLMDMGIRSFLVLEREDKSGGLCRSELVDGAPLDVGGGHFLDVVRRDVLKFLFRFLPKKDWIHYQRCSKIAIHDQFVDYPLESNIWQFPLDIQVKYLMSIFSSLSFSSSKVSVKKFEDWVHYKYGSEIAKNYMVPYNKKLWGVHYNSLSTTWLHKLPDVNYEEILLSCLERHSRGKLPAHARFFYPKEGGFGAVWEKLAESLGENLMLDTPVKSFDFKSLVVNSSFRGRCIVNTIPWPVLSSVSNFPGQIRGRISKLKSVPIRIDYFGENISSPAHWTYVPDEKIPYHRIMHRNNFVPDSRGYWTETNAERVKDPVSKIFSLTNEFAYPVNDLHKDIVISSILDWGKGNNIYGLGRWGTWEHINSDVAVEKALKLSKELANA